MNFVLQNERLCIKNAEFCITNDDFFSARGTCVCDGNFHGAACDSCAVKFYGSNCTTHCDTTVTCSGHGTCDGGGSCTCTTDYYGEHCGHHCNARTTCDGHGSDLHSNR